MPVAVSAIEIEPRACFMGGQFGPQVLRAPVAQEEEEEEEEPGLRDSSSESSSIGKNSDEGDGSRSSASERVHDDDDDEENEAQSRYKGGLDMVEELEQVLPMRRGISKFYNGKSKSFTSLADASTSPSIQEIVKPENAYTRRRRNLLAFNHLWDKSRGSTLRGNAVGGISKRPLSSSKSTLALAVVMTRSESYSSASEDSSSSHVSRSPPPIHLPPLYPRSRGSHNQLASPRWNFSASKSYSLAELHQHPTPVSLLRYEPEC